MKATAYFSKIESHLITLIRNSKSSIKIVVAWLTSVEIMGELINKAEAGLKVTVIVNNSEINFRDRSLLEQLCAYGGEVKVGLSTSPFIHHKFGIFDDTFLINGSYNFTYMAKTSNLENIIIFEFDEETNLLKQFNSIFNQINNYHSSQLSRNVVLESQSEYELIDSEINRINLGLQFEHEILNAVNEAERHNINIRHKQFRLLLKRYGGGVLLAKRLVHAEISNDEPKSGFTKLVFAGHRELTVEFIMLKPQYHELFSKNELNYATKLLY